MNVGQSHNWNYKTKIAKDNGKRFVYRQVKGRNEASPKGSGMPIGSRLDWMIKGIERWLKGKKGYKVIQTGTKYQKGYSTKRKGRLKW